MDEQTNVKTKYACHLTEKHTERWNTSGFSHVTHHADKSLILEKAQKTKTEHFNAMTAEFQVLCLGKQHSWILPIDFILFYQKKFI